MIEKHLAQEAIDGHAEFRNAVDSNLAERFELGEKLKATLNKIDEKAHEEAEIADALLLGSVLPAELQKIKETNASYVKAWREWIQMVREDIRKNLG